MRVIDLRSVLWYGNGREIFGQWAQEMVDLSNMPRAEQVEPSSYFDTSGLEAGDYQLTLRREGGEWQMFPLRIR